MCAQSITMAPGLLQAGRGFCLYMASTQKQISNIGDLENDPRNANRGTVRGRALLEESMRSNGAGRSVLTDRNGVLIAGNKTVEVAAELDLPIRTIHTDGNELVVVVRDDLDLKKDKRARRLAYADNRVGEISLEWEPDVLSEDKDILDGLFTTQELDDLLMPLPDAFKEYDEDIANDVKMCQCPECGHEFPA